MNIDIVLPSILWQNHFLEYGLESQLNNLNLNKLVKYNSISKCSFNNVDIIYQALFQNNMHNELSLDLATQMEIVHKYKSFLLARPIHLITGNNSLYIDYNSIIKLTDFEVDTIIDAINQHFINQLKVFKVTQELLLIAFNYDTISQKSPPPLAMIEKHIYTEDIKLSDNNEFVRLDNEIGMLLFNLELNKKRIHQKKLPINKLWLYEYNRSNDSELNQIINNDTVYYTSLDNYHLNQININHSILIESGYNYDLNKSTNPIKWVDAITYYDKILFTDILNLFKQKKIRLINIFIPKSNYTIKIKIKNSINLLPWRKNSFYSIFKDIINET